MAENAKIVREYLRVSFDRSGRERSQGEQHTDNADAAQRHGWRLDEPYRENGSASASRYGRKVRDAYAQLVADLKAGAFGADVLMLWESSRGSRKVGEWVELIEACELASVVVHVTTHGRTYDPANARDRRSLLEDAVDAEYESGKTSERTKRAMRTSAAAGRPHGTVPFGYARVYDARTGKLIGQEPHPDEAPVVAEVFERLAAGHSLHSIARDFAEREICARSGRAFERVDLRDMALRPCYAALRVHRPEASNRERLDPGGAVEASWEPIVPRELYFRVYGMLSAPERKTRRPGRATNLLSTLVYCDGCGGPLSTSHQTDRRQYRCRTRGCVRIDAHDLDAVAEKAMLAYLAREDIYEQWSSGADDDGELARVRGELAKGRAELVDAENQTPADVHEARALAALTRGLAERIAEWEEQERKLTTPSALADLIGPGPDVAARWAAAPMSARRQVVRLLLCPERLGALRVMRVRGRRGVPAVERITWRRSTEC